MHAYRYLLYWAMLEIRPLGSLRSVSWNPFYWRIQARRIKFAGDIAYWMHNLALYSSVNFEGFEEDLFWRDFEVLRSSYPEFELERYQKLFEERQSGSR
jgi:hypothetical protein